MVVYTDFLAYKEGTYHKTPQAFKFNGFHIVKIVGWEKNVVDGSTNWIVQNSWGEDWGQDGYATMQGGRGDTQIDYYGIGINVLPYTMYDYYSAQNMQDATEGYGVDSQEAEEEINMDDFQQ